MKLKLMMAIVGGLASTAPAFATTLDFQGAGDYNFIQDYYNGGTNDAGASGANFGISFGPDALALTNDEFFSYYSNEPTPSVMSAVGSDAAMNVAEGFAGDVSFYYSASENTFVNIFSGLNGSGTLLATFALAANAQDGCSDSAYCNWDYVSQSLADVAHSIQFGDAAGVAGFDNVSVAPVPLPGAGVLLLSALGGLGTRLRRRKAA